MSITLIVLVVEVILVLLGLVGLLFFFRWKHQKIKTAELEGLLTNFDSQADNRKAQLVNLLEENYALEPKGAEESANYMIEAEKQFLQQFLIQQIEQKPVNDFYQNLCELLDQYLYFVPTLNSEDNNTNIVQTNAQGEVEFEALEKVVDPEQANENSTNELKTSDSLKADSDNATELDETEISEEVSDASEAISTKLDAENTAVQNDSNQKQGEFTDSVESEALTDEIIKESNDSEAEPDWGDAFSESGDEVDKTTEAAYEAEKNKN